MGADGKYQVSPAKVRFDTTIAPDEIDLESGFIMLPAANPATPAETGSAGTGSVTGGTGQAGTDDTGAGSGSTTGGEAAGGSGAGPGAAPTMS